jgi:hypothetical protein
MMLSLQQERPVRFRVRDLPDDSVASGRNRPAKCGYRHAIRSACAEDLPLRDAVGFDRKPPKEMI